MTTVINTPPSGESSDSGVGMVLTVQQEQMEVPTKHYFLFGEK